MNLPIIEIEWKQLIDLDEIYVEDLRPFRIILLTLVKDEEVQLVAYDTEEKKWGLLQN
jgi:hypothetical protein